MSSKIDRLKAELALAEAEEAFVEKKKAGKASPKDKAALRQLRSEYRSQHRKPAKNGAQPESIGASGKV